MWLNSTLVFSGVFGVFSMGGKEVGGVPGDISGSGVFLWDFRGGRWRVWEKPCTDPSVDKQSRERSPLSLSLFFLPASLSLSFLLSFSPVDRTISNRNRIRFSRGKVERRVEDSRALANQRLSARSAHDNSWGFLTGKWERP